MTPGGARRRLAGSVPARAVTAAARLAAGLAWGAVPGRWVRPVPSRARWSPSRAAKWRRETGVAGGVQLHRVHRRQPARDVAGRHLRPRHHRPRAGLGRGTRLQQRPGVPARPRVDRRPRGLPRPGRPGARPRGGARHHGDAGALRRDLGPPPPRGPAARAPPAGSTTRHGCSRRGPTWWATPARWDALRPYVDAVHRPLRRRPRGSWCGTCSTSPTHPNPAYFRDRGAGQGGAHGRRSSTGCSTGPRPRAPPSPSPSGCTSASTGRWSGRRRRAPHRAGPLGRDLVPLLLAPGPARAHDRPPLALRPAAAVHRVAGPHLRVDRRPDRGLRRAGCRCVLLGPGGRSHPDPVVVDLVAAAPAGRMPRGSTSCCTPMATRTTRPRST